VSFGEVALRFFGLFLLIAPLGRLKHFIYETLESVTVLGLVLSLGVKNANAIQEAFKFIRPGPVLLVVSWSLHHIDGTICVPLLVVALGWARLVSVARVLFLFLFPGVEGCLLSYGIFVSDSKHCFWHLRVLHGELMDQGWAPESLLEEHYDRLVIDLRDDISLIVETLDELSEGLFLLLDDAGYVPFNSQSCARGMEVTGEQLA
jgi:hypothetical protein